MKKKKIYKLFNKREMTVRYFTSFFIILLSSISFGVYAQSVYVLANTNANPTPIQAYDMALNLQAQNSPPSQWGAVGLALDAINNFLFITYENSNVIQLVDAFTLQDKGTTTAPGATNLAGIVYDPSNNHVYAVDRGTSNLYVYQWNWINTQLILVKDTTLAGASAYGIALEENQNLLYVANYSPDVTYYNTADWSLAGTLTVNHTAISIAVDEKKVGDLNRYLYTGGGFAYHSYLDQLDLDNTSNSQSFMIGPGIGVMGMAVDQLTNLVYISTGHDGDNLMCFNEYLTGPLFYTDSIGDPTGLVVGAGYYHPGPCSIDSLSSECDSLPIQVCGTFTLVTPPPPWIIADITISLQLYHNSTEVAVIINPTIINNTFCFTLYASDFPAVYSPNYGYDFIATVDFTLTNGTSTEHSIVHSSTPGNGVIPGPSNDYYINCCPSACEDFDDETHNFITYNYLPGDTLNTTANISFVTNASNGTNCMQVTDYEGSTWIYDTLNFSGNYLICDENCICWDMNVLVNDPPDTTSYYPSIFLFRGFDPTQAWGSNNPQHLAKYSSNSLTADNTWVHECVPIDNWWGDWTWINGEMNWYNFISDIDGIMFSIDVTGSADTNEVILFDNICFQVCNLHYVSPINTELIIEPWSDILEYQGWLLPNDQPYSIAPWFYNGDEEMEIIPPNVVDWVLVELRDATYASAATSATIIGQRAALLMTEGTIRDIDGVSLLTIETPPIQDSLYLVVRHMNHIDIMSSVALTLIDGVYTYDFTSGNNKAYGTNAQKYLGNGQYGMIGGDGNADGVVNNDDINLIWPYHAGKQGYLPPDYNLDSQVDNQDKNDIWTENINAVSQVPE